MKQKLFLAVFLVSGILIADVTTKRWAFETLSRSDATLAGVPFTLAFNRGIAFGLDIPSAGRWMLVAASIFVVLMLAGMFGTTKPTDWARTCALSLVAAGAMGNLIDRIRWDQGVVDFIGPINLGFMHWPIFNVADMAITAGAAILALSLWREGSRAKAVALDGGEATAGSPPAATDSGD